jgi:transcription initiation factor TFIIIB Brf1 subunit/transcription initiation factor TFIIB
MDYNVQEIDDIWSEYFTEIKGNQISKDESKICKNCKNDRFNIINGDLMCTCGFIIESRVVSDEPEWNNYTSEDGVMGSNGNRAGTIIDPTNPYDKGELFLPKYHWSWHLDENGVKRYTNLSRLAIRSVYTSKQRAFDEAKYSFEIIQEILGLGPQIFNTAKLLWGIILKTDILKRGGNRRGMKACCVFYACLAEKQQRNREDIAKAFDIDGSSDFTKGEKIFREIFEKNESYSWILFKNTENESMYNRYVSQLGLSFNVNKIMCIIKGHTKDHLLGIAAKSEIAGLLYYTVKDILGLKHPNKSEIASCVGICNPTLNKVIEILKFFYTKFPELKKELTSR